MFFLIFGWSRSCHLHRRARGAGAGAAPNQTAPQRWFMVLAGREGTFDCLLHQSAKLCNIVFLIHWLNKYRDFFYIDWLVHKLSGQTFLPLIVIYRSVFFFLFLQITGFQKYVLIHQVKCCYLIKNLSAESYKPSNLMTITTNNFCPSVCHSDYN